MEGVIDVGSPLGKGRDEDWKTAQKVDWALMKGQDGLGLGWGPNPERSGKGPEGLVRSVWRHGWAGRRG